MSAVGSILGDHESNRTKQISFAGEEAVPRASEQSVPDRDQFTKDIINEDFYVLYDDAPVTFEFEVAAKEESEEVKKDEQQKETFELTENGPVDQDIEEDSKRKEKPGAEDLDKDFFEKGVDEDADKKRVVQEIAGMTEVVEEDEEDVDEPKKEFIRRPSAIQFGPVEKIEEEPALEKAPEGQGSKETLVKEEESRKSLDQETPSPSMTRRPSGIPELSKLSRKSLLAVMSIEGLGSRKSEAEKIPGKRDGDMRLGSDVWDTRASKLVYESRRSTRRSTAAQSFAYAELGPRYRQLADEDDMLEGFDEIGGGGAPIFLDELPEEEEHTIKEEEEMQEFLDRAPFYERHDKAAQGIIAKKIKNFILQKKLAMYFKRKKMDYVTKEVEWSFDVQSKYYRKLEAYGELSNFVSLEKERITQEIEDTKQQRTDTFNELKNFFKKMQDREGEIGYGLINTKTGNILQEKFVERLIRRQYNQMTQVSSMRLTFIRLKGMVQEKLNAIAALDEIAPGFLLADYEQLKSDNRAYADKIEEKDEELARLRSKCGNTIQVLAHLREKSTALDSDLEDLLEECQALDQAFFDVRSKVNCQKQYRDQVRNLINKMRNESGLLTQPTLLKDMEKELTEIKMSHTDNVNGIPKNQVLHNSVYLKNISEGIGYTNDICTDLEIKSKCFEIENMDIVYDAAEVTNLLTNEQQSKPAGAGTIFSPKTISSKKISIISDVLISNVQQLGTVENNKSVEIELIQNNSSTKRGTDLSYKNVTHLKPEVAQFLTEKINNKDDPDYQPTLASDCSYTSKTSGESEAQYTTNSRNIEDLQNDPPEKINEVNDLQSVSSNNRTRRENSDESDTVVGNESEDNLGRPSKGRKRKYEGQTFKSKKHLQYANKSYYTEKGKLITGKNFIENYKCNCKSKCSDLVSKEKRKKAFENFYKLANYDAQTAFIGAKVRESAIKIRIEDRLLGHTI